MQSDPPKLIIRQSLSRIEIQIGLISPTFLQRNTSVMMDSPDRFEDGFFGKRKHNLGRVKVSNDRQAEDSLRGFFCPVFEDLGRIVMLPKPILKTEHFNIAKFFHIEKDCGATRKPPRLDIQRAARISAQTASESSERE